MLKKNSVAIGLIIGILTPIIVFAILYFINTQARYKLREPTIFLIATCTNVLFVRYFINKKGLDLSGRGVMLSIFIFAAIYVIRYVVLEINA